MKTQLILSFILTLTSNISFAQSADELLDIAYGYEVSQPDSALILYHKAFEMYVDSANDDGAGRSLAYSGIVCSDHGRFNEALTFIDSSNVYWQRSAYKKGIASNYNNKANIYLYQDYYKTAAKWFTKAAEIFEEIKDTSSIGIAFGNITNVYVRLKRYDEAIKIGQKNLNLMLEFGDTLSIGFAYTDLAATNAKLSQWDRMKFNLDASKAYINHNSDLYLQIVYFKNKSYYHLLSNSDYKAVLKSAERFSFLAEQSGRPLDKAQADLLLGHALYGLGNLKESLPRLSASIEVSLRNHFLSELVEAYGLQAKVYEALGKNKLALNVMKSFAAYSDSLLNEDIHSQTQELLLIFETAKKDQELLQAQLDIKDQELKLERNKYFMLGLTSLIILLIVVSIYQVNRVRMKKRAHQQHMLLLAKEEELKLVTVKEEAEEEERNRIAAELHDGVNGMLAGIKFHAQSYFKQHKLVDDQSKEIIQYLGQASTEVRSISHKLGSTQLKELGLKRALEHFVKPMIADIEFKFSFVQKEPMNRMKEQILFRCIQEMVFNAFKHAEASTIQVDVVLNEKQWHVTVSDNGKGMTGGKEGYGMESLSRRFEKMNGSLTITSSSKGTILTAAGTL